MNSMRQNFLLGLNKLGAFLMKGRREATIAAMLTAAFPFLGWASLAIVAFVTLRKGSRDGLFVLCWSIIPAILMAYFMMGTVAVAIESLVSYGFVWGLALLLRATASWAYVLELAFFIAIVFVVFLYWLIPDLNDIYAQNLVDLYQNAGANPQSVTTIRGFIEKIVYYLLGLQTTVYVLQSLLALLIGRGLQAFMFNPGGLSLEIKGIRLRWMLCVLAVICTVFGFVKSYDWAIATFPIWIALFLIAGFSVIHYGIKQRIQFKGAILLFYVLCILLFPFSIIPVVLLAWIDTIWNVRRFL